MLVVTKLGILVRGTQEKGLASVLSQTVGGGKGLVYLVNKPAIMGGLGGVKCLVTLCCLSYHRLLYPIVAWGIALS